MKLTEAQLKRIIAEEVQTAIDEGILDWFSNSGDAGSYREPGTSFSDRLKGAAGRLTGAAKKAIGGAAKVADVGLSFPKTLDDAAVNAIYASRTGKDKRLVQKASALVNQLSRAFEDVSVIDGGKQQIMDMINTLALSGDIDLDELAKSVASSRAAGREALANAPRSARGPEGAGQVTSRIGAGVRSIPGYGSMEEQADAITEAILKRIIQKR